MSKPQTRALVTGGSGAIGTAICMELAAQGLHVIVHGNKNAAGTKQVAEEIMRCGGSAEPVTFDVSDADACGSAAKTILEDGPVQVIVSNAGISDDGPMVGLSHAQWQRVIDVSLNGFFNIVQPLLLPMMRTRWGRVVAVTSIAGIFGNRGQTNYAAAKAGLHGACKSLAREVASRGVTVNAVAPGIIATPMSAAAFPEDEIKRLVPLQRAGTPEEVADLIAYLVTPGAAYITGQVISINGGML